MTFPALPAGFRFGYDIDGTAVTVNGAAALLAQVQALNNEEGSGLLVASGDSIVFHFPQHRSVVGFGAGFGAESGVAPGPDIEWSDDSTDGVDGTWHAISCGWTVEAHPGGVAAIAASWPVAWRFPATISSGAPSACRWLRVSVPTGGDGRIAGFHIYGTIDNSDGLTLSMGWTGASHDAVVPTFNRNDVQFLAGDLSVYLPNPGPWPPSTNVGLSVEALTDPPTRSLAEQTLIAHLAEPVGGVAPNPYQATTGPDTLAHDGTDDHYYQPLLIGASDADLGGPWCYRVRADADGMLPAVLYVFIDNVVDTAPVSAAHFSVEPHIAVLADTTEITLLMAGAPTDPTGHTVELKFFDQDDPASGYQGPFPYDSWTAIGPSAHAFDGSRFAGTNKIDPRHVAFTFKVPSSFLGSSGLTVGVFIDGQFVTPISAHSPDLTVAAISFLSGSASATDTSAGGEVVLRQDAEPIDFDPTNYGYRADELIDSGLYPPTPIIQRRMNRSRAPYAIVDGLAVDPPILGAMSKSVAYARSFSAIANLGAEAALGLMGATARWLADPADITGGDHWHPHFGVGPNFVFSALGTTVPYVDPSYDYYARHEIKKVTQALVFDGTSWANFAGSSSQGGFSWVIVAVLHHPANRSHYDILASPSAATDPDRATDAVLRYDNGYIRSFGGQRLSSALLRPPTYRGRIRPVILAWAEGGRGGTLGVIDALGRHWQDYAHPNKVNYDLRMKLGQNGSTDDVSYAAEMDILDVLYWDVRHTRTALSPVITKLDGVYGVTGR